MTVMIPQSKQYLRYVDRFSKGIAGAESNVAIGVSKLGHSSRYLSKVGNDEFGEYIIRELKSEGVDTGYIQKLNDHPTGLMVKQFDAAGGSSVFYYRKHSAASTLSPTDITREIVADASIVHITGVTSALGKNCAAANERLAELAGECDCLISFDPNIRLKLWSREEARRTLYPLLKKCDLVLLGVEEADILLGIRTPEKIIERLRGLGVKKMAIKLGANGAIVAEEKEIYRIPAYPVKVVDEIGAGDAFASGFLSGVLEGKGIEACGKMGALMGAMAVSSVGDVEGLPDREAMDHLLADDIIRR